MRIQLGGKIDAEKASTAERCDARAIIGVLRRRRAVKTLRLTAAETQVGWHGE